MLLHVCLCVYLSGGPSACMYETIHPYVLPANPHPTIQQSDIRQKYIHVYIYILTESSREYIHIYMLLVK